MHSRSIVAMSVIALLASLLGAASADPIIYATGDYGRELLKIDAKTGTVEKISAIGRSTLLAFGPGGKLYTITNSAHGVAPDPNNQLATIDPASGKVSLIGKPFGKGIRAWAMGFTQDGALYAAAVDENVLYRIDLNTGALAEVGPLDGGEAIMDFAVHPQDGTLYAVTYGILYTLDPSSAKLTKIGDITKAHPNIMAIAFDQDGTLYAVNYDFKTSTWLYKLDPATAVAEKIAAVPARYVHSADIGPKPPVPAP